MSGFLSGSHVPWIWARKLCSLFVININISTLIRENVAFYEANDGIKEKAQNKRNVKRYDKGGSVHWIPDVWILAVCVPYTAATQTAVLGFCGFIRK